VESKIFYEKEYLEYNPEWHINDSYFKFLEIKKIIKKNKLQFKNFCEVGCGAGKILVYLSKKYKNKFFYGYEISRKAYSMSDKKLKNVKYYNKILNKKKTFDIILCADVLEHVENPYKFLREIKKTSKYQILHIPLDLSINSIFRKSVLLKARKEVGHLHFYNKELILHDLQKLNFKVVDYYYTFNENIYTRGSWAQKLIATIRKLIFFVNRDLAVNFLGGFSLLILTK